MVDRAHLENPFATGRLEIADLQNDRKRFAPVDNAGEYKQQRQPNLKRERDHQPPEEERAGVPHKDLGRVEIPDQESESTARERTGNQTGLFKTQDTGNHQHDQRIDKGDRGSQPIDAVGKVDCIDKTGDDDNCKRVVEEPQLELSQEREHHHGRTVARKV